MKKPVKTAKDLSPAPMLDKVKAMVSPKSTTGLLRDRDATVAKKLKGYGA